MALSENLPVFKVAYDLLREVYRLSVNMDRAYRFTLGERVQREMTEMLLNIYRANCVYDKANDIRRARDNSMAVRILFRVAHDEKQVSLKAFISVNDKIESISKQLTAWGKSVTDKKLI